MRILLSSLLGLTSIVVIFGLDFSFFETHKNFIRGNNKFALKLFRALSRNDSRNVFISPLSITNCLSMIYFMSNGTTQREIEEVMNFPENEPDFVGQGLRGVLSSIGSTTPSLWANKAYVDQNFTLKDEYRWAVELYLNSSAENVDFRNESDAVRQIINSWVEEQTNGKIVDLLKTDSLSSLTRMVLVSTVYFKERWQVPFSKEKTKLGKFTLSNGTETETHFIATKAYLGYYENHELDARVVQIPYKDYKYTLTVILPNKVDGLEMVEEKLLHSSFHKEVLHSVYYLDVEVMIPKFSLEFEVDLKDALLELGMKRSFNSDQSDFSNGTDAKGLELNAVHHKTSIVLNEEGTEASAASGAILEMRIDAPRRMVPPVVANHPFLYVITESPTDSIVFMGRFVIPDE